MPGTCRSGVGNQRGERRASDHAIDNAQHKADAVVRALTKVSLFLPFSVRFA